MENLYISPCLTSYEAMAESGFAISGAGEEPSSTMNNMDAPGMGYGGDF